MLEQICQLAREAGDAIMQVYNAPTPPDVIHKSDNSPVTAADIAAHKIIVAGLQALSPQIPILSEEDPADWTIRQHWQTYWLVDPLDGTKEFIKRNGEFTVNIALIEKGKPVLGVVYAPVLDVMYSAAEEKRGRKKRATKSRSRCVTPVHRWWLSVVPMLARIGNCMSILNRWVSTRRRQLVHH